MANIRVDMAGLVKAIKSKAHPDKRFLVAIAGPPGSGKSTLAEKIAAEIGSTAVVLPMDGFHMDNAELDQLGLLHRKGAPETFDPKGFIDLIRKIPNQPALSYPTFDRPNDRTVPDGGKLEPNAQIIIAEGNYLLLNQPRWSDLAPLFDLTVFLDVGMPELETRLIQRWLDHGLAPADAVARARGNDLRNAQLVTSQSLDPDYLMSES